MATPRTRSVQKAFNMLRAFRTPDEWLTSAELSRRAGLPEASGYRLIQTLEEIGAVIRDPRGRYGPGMLLVSLSRNVARDRLLREASLDTLSEVASQLDLIVHMGVMEDGMVTYLAKAGFNPHFHVHTAVGAQLEAYCSALGKVLLSGLSHHELRAFLEEGDLIPLTPNTITEPHAFQCEIDAVRKRGWAIDDRENTPHLRCMAAPVHDIDGAVVAAISASGHEAWLSEGREPEILVALRAAADSISKNIRQSFARSPHQLLRPSTRERDFSTVMTKSLVSA